MPRNTNLLIDKLRTRAWVNAFLAELQGIKGTSTPLSPSGAVKILNEIIANSDIIPDSKKTVKEIFPDEDNTPELTSQFHRWISGKSLISSTNRLISLFSFSELVFTTGIPQAPALHNIRIPDEEFETFTHEEKKQGKAFVFDFYDAPPLWASVKGTPHQILEAWKRLKQNPGFSGTQTMPILMSTKLISRPGNCANVFRRIITLSRTNQNWPTPWNESPRIRFRQSST